MCLSKCNLRRYAKAAEKKPRPNKPRHIKGSKAKGGGRGAKALKKKKFAK